MASEFIPFELEASDAQIDEKKQRAKLADEQEIKALQWVMSDKRGRDFIWWLLGTCGVFRISYTGNSETYFREGMRQIGVALLDRIKTHCDELYFKMERERINVRRNADDGSKQH